ncbi:hypothetical protein F4V43_16140 [Paenibacillus spiritus]|uniref:Uncharacterized protein n=1 Tax=Paenibacillus spiritus TaxID=2496557 RepID=A0A5J5FXT9_9BACL|nr:hypothetical protein [Paenibacillus spiritus]KAA8998759.1 hypothetical protein F4V43_16140 [Paenibacillus spiritus]
MTLLDTSDVTSPLFITVLLFLLVLVPLVSLGILRLVQSRRRSALALIGSSVLIGMLFLGITSLMFQ